MSSQHKGADFVRLRQHHAAIMCPDDNCHIKGDSVPFPPASIAACVPGAVFELHMEARKHLEKTLMEEVCKCVCVCVCV